MNPFDSEPEDEEDVDPVHQDIDIDEIYADPPLEGSGIAETFGEQDEGLEDESTLKRPKLDGRKNHHNLIMPSLLTLGVVTWNVAHFGAGKLAAVKALKAVRERMAGFEKDWSRKGKWQAGAFAEQLVEYLDEYERWEYQFSLALKKRSTLRDATAWGKLEKAAERHRWVPGEKEAAEDEEDAEDEEEEQDEEEGESVALKEGADEPEGLARMLGEQWKRYDERHGQGEWAKKKTLVEEWSAYFVEAFARCEEAWKSFNLQWSQLLDEQDEDAAQQGILEDMGSLVLSTKDLRAAVKMVVKPVLQLRQRANLANKVQAAARAKAKKQKIAALDQAREALAEARKASRWKIGPLFTAVEALDKMLHKVLVAAHIDLMFKQNEKWLDAVVLQEVNQGIDVLEEYLDKKGYRCIRGFTLRSRSGKQSQTEYYPLVIRKGGRIEPHSLAAVYNDNGVVDAVHYTESPPLAWNKTEGIYRPILTYDVWVTDSKSRTELVTIGVVHTSPSGREMSRELVFGQVKTPLRMLSFSSLPAVVGGDYYLTEEALTVGWSSLGEEGRQKAEELKDQYSKKLKKKIKAIDAGLKELAGGKPAKGRGKRKQSGTSGEPDPEQEEESRQREKNALLEKKKPLLELLDALRSDKVQLIRNDGKLAVSVGHQIRELGLELAQPITGTNWKTKSVLSWFNAQIADFFVHTGPNSYEPTSRWTGSRVGLVSPTGGLRVADVEELWLSKYWRCASDHFPVGIILTRSWNQLARLALNLPFLDLGQHLTWGVRAQDRNTAREPREVLGITNPGNTCYINAALQLLWRMDLQASYVTGDPGLGLRAIVEEVNGILALHRHEGQTGTYGSYGKDHVYTTALTIGLRAELSSRGAAQGVFAQSDAGEALLKILEAFEHPVFGFSAGSQTDLAQTVGNGDFGDKRPSQCHFIMEVRTRYQLGDPFGGPQGVLRVDENGIATTYRCFNVLSFHLPPEKKRPSERDKEETTGKEERTDRSKEEEAEPLDPITWEDLRDMNWNLDYGNDGDTKAVDTADGHYPNARALAEEIRIAVPPAHWLVQIERFVAGGEEKKFRKVKMPGSLDDKPLKGFIVHLGGSAYSGHYVAYVEHGGKWYCLNDDQVIEDPPDREAALEEAYILYYE